MFLVELRRDPRIERVRVVESQDVILRTDYGGFGRAVAKGMDRESLRVQLSEIRRAYLLNHERKLTQEQLEERLKDEVETWMGRIDEKQVLVGQDLARNLDLVVGDRLLLIPPEVLLLPPELAPPTGEVFVGDELVSEVADIDANYIFYVSGEAMRALGGALSKTLSVELQLRNPERFADLKLEIIGQGYNVESWQDRNAALFFALRLEKTTMGTFLLISALITCCSIFIVMVLLITQKKTDLGILLAMGLSRSRAVGLFARMGFALSALGSLSGLVFGSLLALWLQTNAWDVLPEIYYDSTIPARLEWSTVLGIGAFVLGFGALMAWLPARSLATAKPVDSLRKGAL
jgi:lipoprotein-releasing system permease protein